MNYWQTLTEARRALGDGRFRDAESSYDKAAAGRESDGRRVFFSETLPDGARSLWRRVRRQEPSGPEAGRWDRAAAAFRADFRARSSVLLRRAEQQLDQDPVAEPDSSFAVLDAALYLSVGSRLVERRLAVSPLLVSLFRLLPVTGRLCTPDLVTPELGLDAATRLQLADAALDGLPRLAPDERDVWAGTLMNLLGAEGCSWSPSQTSDRRWQRARLADHHRRDPVEVLDCWRTCDHDEQTEPRRQWSRLRRLEILAGRDPRSLPVPRYEEAHQLARLLPRDGDDEAACRTREALAIVEHRRPRTDPDQGWLSAAAGTDGTVHLVFWWGAEPRDVAGWHPDDEPEALTAFLAAAGGRVIWHDAPAESLFAHGWPADARGRDLPPYLETVLEPLLPSGGWSDELGERLALARSGPWRDHWRADLGHPLLGPPGADGRLAPNQSAIGPALRTGLLWLAVLHRVDNADPAMRAGFGELGRRGDPAAAFLHACAILGAADKVVVDGTFEPWTMPLLWTRPDPLTAARPGDGDEFVREDLAGQDVAVVATGRPGRVLDAWSPGERRWRVVLDRLDRLPTLRRQVREAYGPVTVVPRAGRVHDLHASLALLDDLAVEAGRAADPGTGMLAICHWIRLVETHNGDLLDDRMLRPRPIGTCPIHDRYAARIADLPRHGIPTEGAGDDDGWGSQYSQRVRRSGLVAGLSDELPDAAPVLDALWGVFDGSDACWVFLDSAAIHWRLHRRDPGVPGRLHAMLAPRGRRHLSLVSNRGPLPGELSAWLDGVLAVYGRPYHLSLDDERAGTLRLAGSGPLPNARLRPAEAWSAPLAHLAEARADTAVRAPVGGLAAAFWQAAAEGAFGPVSWTLETTGSTGDATRLVVPRLASLAPLAATVAAVADSPEAWRAADQRRDERLERCRRLAALECSALMAEEVACVEVLDTGWWRLLAAAATTPAAMLDGTVGMELLELGADPASSATRRQRELTAAWLGERGVVPGLLPGWDGQPLADAGTVEEDGRSRHRAPAVTLWRDLAADLLAAWEQGTSVPRLLVVAETPPAGAAALAAACGGAGVATLDAVEGAAAGPLVWARPDDLLARLRAGRPLPSFERALVLDLERYLPGGRDAEDGGRMLGVLAGEGVRRLDLVGGELSPAWSRFLADRLDVRGPAPAGDAGGWTMLRRGEIPRPRRRCPQCGAVEAGAVDGLVCAGCGYHLVDIDRARREEDSMATRARQLLGQADQGRDEPLAVWGTRDDLAALADRACDAEARLDAGAPGLVCLADGRRWQLRAVEDGDGCAEGQAVLLRTPIHPIDLRPQAAVGNRKALTLLYDRADIAVPGDRPAARMARDLLQVLAGGGWREGARASTERSAAAATVPLWRLGWLAGMAPAEVRRALDILRWVTGIEDSPIVVNRVAAGQPVRLLTLIDAHDVELQLAGLAARVESTLASMLAGGLPGAWSETVAPRAVADESGAGERDVIDPLDRVLALAADWPLAGGGRLLYRAPDGAWFNGRRRVGWLGDRGKVTADLVRALDGFAHWIRTVPFGDGRRSAGTVVELRDPDAAVAPRWILLGQELGFWTAADPVGPQYMRDADLARLTESPLVAADGAAAVLLTRLAEEGDRWRHRLVRTPAGGALAPAITAEPPSVSGDTTRPWWRRGEHDPLADVHRRVAACVATEGSARLVLVGPMGSGRTDGLVAGLAGTAAGRGADIWCPDISTAARLHLAVRREDPTWQPRIRVWRPEDPLPAQAVAAPGERRVMVVAELDRFPQATAYRLQELAREGALVMTVDASEVPAGDAWEGLFLTTPRRGELLRLQVQVLQARAPWRVTRPLLPTVRTEARSVRRERGQVESRQAGTLDECAATVTAAVRGGRLDELVAATVPLLEDVQLLGRALTDCGWAAVPRDRLEPLLLPGTLEFTAAMADAHRRRHGVWPGSPGGAARGDGHWLLADLLPTVAAKDWGAWLRGLPDVVLDDAAAFTEQLRRSPWGPVCLAYAEGRARADAMLAAGGRAPEDLLDPPLWQTWRRRVALLLSRPDLAPEQAAAVLAAASDPGGDPLASGVYICFGPEPAAVHRRVLSGVTDRILVLYQEYSPLPGERDLGDAT